MPMLDAATTAQLKAYLANLRRPIELVASLGSDAKSNDTRALVEEIAVLSDKITARFDGTDARRPSFAIRADEGRAEAVFAGLPLGHEFTSLILALLHVGGHPPKEDAELLDQVRALAGPLHFETFFSLSCQNCPDVVQALNMIAALNPNASHVAIDGALFQDEVERRQIMAVPMVFLNGELFGQGRMDLAQIVAKLDTGAVARAADKIAAKEPFDVLVVGGGPAGAAAAIYAARKGIRTGVVSERFGGQVLDTMGIENFISVSHTEGPRLVAQLEQHVKDYDVDVMNLQKAVALKPANGDGLATVELESGASVRAKTVILSTGARWRQMGVPGEDEYRNKGVAYCPHCDGPLYKGKRVAVIGGGNVAMDAARTAIRLGAEETVLVYISDPAHLEAHPEEAQAAFAEGARIKWMSAVERFGAQGVVIEKLSLKPDGGVAPTGETERLAADSVILAVGEHADLALLRGAPDVAIRPDGVVGVDPVLMTGQPGIFAGGDCIGGARTMTAAVGHGKLAARAMMEWMDKKTYRRPASHPLVTFEMLHLLDYLDAPREEPRETPLTLRSGFGEIVAGLDEAQARFEAMRCLSCGNCFECDNCYAACPEQAIARLGPGRGYEVDLTLCTGCAVCFEQCPCHAIEMTTEPAPQDLQNLASASRTIGSLGEPIAPSRFKVRL